MRSVIEKILSSISRAVLNKYKPDIIGITGSFGKTSTKEAVYAVLKSNYLVRKNIKNYNNEIGLPLSILGFESPGRSIFGWIKVLCQSVYLLMHYDKSYPWILVLEMGADKPGDIQYLIDIAPCKVGVLTGVGPTHLEQFGTVANIFKEKKFIVTGLPEKDGWAVLNGDDKLVSSLQDGLSSKTITYGLSKQNDVYASDIVENFEFSPDQPIKGVSFNLNYKNKKIKVELNDIIGRQQIYSVLAAAALGFIYDLGLSEVKRSLQNYHPAKGRMRLIEGIKKTMIIDDSYNSSPEAVKAAIEVVNKIKINSKAKKIAVLGDMLELGSYTQQAHEEIGEIIANSDIDLLITIGASSKFTASSAIEAGFDKSSVLCFDQSEQAQKLVQEKIKSGDIILVKGSQGMRTEKIVKEIMAHPEFAEKILVRQGSEWS